MAPYRAHDRRKAILQIANSFVPFLLLWGLMVWSLDVSYLLTLALAFPAVGFMIRIFIIQHDCGHGSFFKSKRANEIVGSICGILTLTPYHHWRHSHAIHHATASNLERRGTGDIWTMTVREYQQASPWRRFTYRLYRHPLVLFLLGPPLMLVILQRFPENRLWLWNRERASILWTNLALGGILAGAWLTIGLKAFLMVQVPIILIAANAGTWLFYVQHQFTDTYWEHDGRWDYERAAMQGSSYYKLPRVLQFFTGNIGFHHIHHLSPNVPNYNLERCHCENPSFQKVFTLTLRSSLRTALLTLWDEERRKLVRFRDVSLQPSPTPA